MHFIKVEKVKITRAVNGTPSLSYGVSLALWDHTVLSARGSEEVIHLTVRGVEASLFTGEMPLLSANRLHQSTERLMDVSFFW